MVGDWRYSSAIHLERYVLGKTRELSGDADSFIYHHLEDAAKRNLFWI
jgi:hypothetical protein